MKISKSILSIIAIVMVSLLAFHSVMEPVRVRAAISVFAAIIIAAAISGAVGYYLGHYTGARVGAMEQYKSDVNLYTKALSEVYRSGWYNIFIQMDDMHKTFFNNTFSYYARWSESIASNVCARQDKTEVSDEDLKPILEDLSKILGNYILTIMDGLKDLYFKGWWLAGLRKNAGIDDRIEEIFSRCGVFHDGILTCVVHFRPVYVSVIVNDVEVGREYIRESTRYVNESSIMYILSSSDIYSVSVGFVDDTKYFAMINAIYGYDNYDIPQKLREYFINVRTMYLNSKMMANTLCYTIKITGGYANIPPPSIALPFDLNTLNKIDPLSRMQLYYTYLYYLSQTDWSKIKELTVNSIYGLPNGTVKVCGSVDLNGDGNPDVNGCFIPWNLIFPMTFMVNGLNGIGGQWYYFDPTNGTLRIITIPIYPVNGSTSYTIIRNITEYQKLVQLDDGRQFVGVDVDGDGKIDYLVPLMYVNELKDVKYDPSTGQYTEQNVDKLRIGPQNVQEWTQKKLADVEGLKKVEGGGNPFEGIMNWFNSLSWNFKIALIAGGVILILIIVLALGGRGGVVVVNSRR